jgi:hypothetical protein
MMNLALTIDYISNKHRNYSGQVDRNLGNMMNDQINSYSRRRCQH